MTIHQMSRYYRLGKAIESCRDRLRELRAMAYDPPAPALSGMPRGGSVDKARIERLAVLMEETEERMQARIDEWTEARVELEHFLATVDDPLMYTILSSRFVEGKSWIQVAFDVGGDWTDDGVRKRAVRYLASRDEEAV